MKEQMLNLLKDDRFVISNNIIKVALEKELLADGEVIGKLSF